MSKIVCIGECSLNVVMKADGTPLGSMTGGRIACAATLLAQKGLSAVMASEISADAVGDAVIKPLVDAGVNVASIDRFTEGRTPINIITEGEPSSLTRYENYPDEAFDIVWPRIENDDVVIFGGYYALDPRMHQRMARLLSYAKDMKAVVVYLPGFLPQQEPRITRIMPQILENLELADLVVTRNKDLSLIFGVDSADKIYRNRIDFYCRSLVNVDEENESITYYSGKEMSSVNIPVSACRTMLWNAGALAGLTAEIVARRLTPESFENPDAALREALIGAASNMAAEVSKTLTASWQEIH